ncbi:MAG: hypothetical protein ABJC04_13140, partial [Verrucomicrobiota bacterium]
KYRYIFPQHINYFTSSTLKKFTETEPSLEIAAAGSMHFNPMVIWQDFRHREEFVSDEERIALLKRTTAAKKNPMLKPAKWLYQRVENILGEFNLADNLFIVLRKRG